MGVLCTPTWCPCTCMSLWKQVTRLGHRQRWCRGQTSAGRAVPGGAHTGLLAHLLSPMPLGVSLLSHGDGIMLKWLQSPPNQGPDPSLVYRPDVDPERAKEKGSFRDYTVRTPTPTLCCPQPHPFLERQHSPWHMLGGTLGEAHMHTSGARLGRREVAGPWLCSCPVDPTACSPARSWTASSPPTSSCILGRLWTSSGRRYLTDSFTAALRVGPPSPTLPHPSTKWMERRWALPTCAHDDLSPPDPARPVWGLFLQENDCPGGCGHAEWAGG